jgi:N-acetylmuramoyl-L-alanine amidase
VTFRLCLAGAAACAAIAAMHGPSAYAAARAAPVRAPAADFPVASDVRVGGDDKQARFVMDFSRKIDVATFTLADPYRVVVDLPQVVFKLPAKAGEHGRGLIKAFRYGLIMKGGSRIVLDTKGPVRVAKAFTLAAAAGQPARLVLELSAIDRASFLHTIAVEIHADRRMASPRVNVTPAADNDPRPLIVLDPGHGGIDTGTRSRDRKYDEKNVVLAFALKLRDDLERSGKYRVAMTRNDDTYVSLGDRVRFARAHHAALFISIHADSVPRGKGEADGASIYTLSEKASDAEAAYLAESENKSDVIAGVDLTAEPDDVANILVDLAQRETKTFSVQFARTAMGELKIATPLHKHPVKSAGFKVLTAPDVPSVLIELGYMSDKGDLKHLTAPAWRKRTAAALKQAIDTYFAPRLAGAANGAR